MPMTKGKLFLSTILLMTLAGCSRMHKLEKSDPYAALHLPYNPTPAVEEAPRHETPKIITFKKDDGTELTLTLAETDEDTGEKIMSLAIDEVIISARNRRNLVERNGKINIDFVVTVPPSLLHSKWQLALDPTLTKGGDTLTFSPLVYRGGKFSRQQLRDYERYGKYLGTIVDSADYFEAFGDKESYNAYLSRLYTDRKANASDLDYLRSLQPRQAATDARVGWSDDKEHRRMKDIMRRYINATDRKVARHVVYTPDSSDEYDHLNDYLTPRYVHNDVEQPGGQYYTRIDGRFHSDIDAEREEYYRSLDDRDSHKAFRRQLRNADERQLAQHVEERYRRTHYAAPVAQGVAREASDSALMMNYAARVAYYEGLSERLAKADTEQAKRDAIDLRKVARNEARADNKDEVFARTVAHPYIRPARLDTIIHNPNGSVSYVYNEQIKADENTSKINLFLRGGVDDTNGNHYALTHSDTLHYNVASMASFVDEQTRYMQRIIYRDAEANARFYFTFPLGKYVLDKSLEENTRQIGAVKDLTRKLMTDPVFIIDSITLRATSSPEGSWPVNNRLASRRAASLKEILDSEFKVLYDSLKLSASVTLDEQGRQVTTQAENNLPDLPRLLRSTHLAEDWNKMRELISADPEIENKEKILALIDEIENPDVREYRIRTLYTKDYQHIRKTLYPEMRAVDFRFNLHRRGMKKDTVYTTEVDSQYMHAVDLLKKRNYDEAIKILRPYEDRNTALAYLSLGYDYAALRILSQLPDGHNIADVQYMLAIVAARVGEEELAVTSFLRAVELKESLKFRGNLDPEISQLIRKYGLFKEDFEH